MLNDEVNKINSSNEVNEVVNNTFSYESSEEDIVIRYSRPKFAHRVLANLLDFIIFALMFVCCFLLSRYIVSTTDRYKSSFNSINKMRIDSGLFVKNGKEVLDVVSYMKSDTSFNDNAIVIKSEKVVNQFFTFEEGLISENKLNSIKNKYDELRLAKTNSDGEHLFIIQDETIIKDPELYEAKKSPYAKFYCNYIDNYLQGYLSTTPKYYDATKDLSNLFLWVEIPSGLFGGIFITYLLPSLIFVRGRSTFAKALYRIGTVDSRYLSPSFWRNLSKWGIFTIEFVAGIASLGIIFILSFTMMAFSKNRQGFPDFMLGLQEVDMAKNKVYKSLDEIKLESVTTNKKATDFRLIDHP